MMAHDLEATGTVCRIGPGWWWVPTHEEVQAGMRAESLAAADLDGDDPQAYGYPDAYGSYG